MWPSLQVSHCPGVGKAGVDVLLLLKVEGESGSLLLFNYLNYSVLNILITICFFA